MAKKMGRPPKRPEDRLSEIVPVRMTKAERADFEDAADLAGVPFSEWVRTQLTSASARERKRNKTQAERA